MTSPIPLAYGKRQARRFIVKPWVLAPIHFILSYRLWAWSFDRLMHNVVAAMFNPNFRPPTPTMLERVVDFIGSLLLFPLNVIHWPEIKGVPLWVCFVPNSILWGLACRAIIRWRRRYRPAKLDDVAST